MSKVSVIITTYNSMQYLPETLYSVLGQIFTDFDVIVIDDGSTDQTIDWVNTVHDPRLTLISQKNQGVSVARNTGICHAKGQYIALLDGDDVWEPTKLLEQVKIMDSDPDIGLVYTWLALIDEQSRPTGRIMKPDSEGKVWTSIIENNMVACSSVMVRSACFENVGIFDSNLLVAEDWDLWIRIAASYSFAVVREPLVQYRLHSNSKSKNYPAMVQNFRTIIERAFLNAPLELLYLRGLSYGRVNLCISWKCLQCEEPNIEKASYFCHQGLLHYPPLFFSKEYIRLKIAIFLMKWFGLSSYDRLLSLLNVLRRRFTILSSS